MKGTIVRKRDEGYGFINPAEGDKDVFFHASAISEDIHFDDLKEGMTVSFDLEEGPKGPAAANVTIVADDAQAADDNAPVAEETEGEAA